VFTTVQIVLLVLISLGLLVLPKDMLGPAYALAFGFTTVVQALLAVWLLRRRIGFIDASRILASLLLYAIAAVPALIVGLVAMVIVVNLVPEYGILAAIGLAIVVALLVGAVYLLGLRLLRSPELAELTGFISRKLGRNRS
jgi:putative peptidoglycan lipid II flippase